jgi:hypothetical protein
MDSRPVSAEYLKAGGDYLDSLRTLGLTPNFLGWGWDISAGQWVLVLVTSIINAGGPLALNKLLFQAYSAKATPKEISPFIVRIFSPEIIPNEFYFLGEKNLRAHKVNEKPNIDLPPIRNFQLTFMDIELEMVNSYQNRPVRKLKYQERRRLWDRFKSNVERLAA